MRLSITSTNSGTGDHITIGAAIDSNATGTLTIDAHDAGCLGNELNHAGAVVLTAQGAGANTSNNQEKGKIYGDSVLYQTGER